MSSNILTIYILNVGQADTSVIKTPKGEYIVIDAVQPDKLNNLLKKIGLRKKNDLIREMIITHPHIDHFSGANSLLNKYKVMSVTLSPFWNKYGSNPSPSYNKMLEKITSKYISDQFAADLELAVQCRDESIRLQNKRKFAEADEKWKEAEFFLVFTHITPKLNEQQWFMTKHKEAFNRFAEDMNKRKISIKEIEEGLKLIQ